MLKVVVTCEHGGNLVPERYRPLFRNQAELLHSHRGYDLGALPLFVALAGEVADAAFVAEETRLLVDLNRSLHAPDLFSECTDSLSSDEQEEVLRDFYFPFRSAVETKIRRMVGEGGQVLHLSVHTFTPVLGGEVRQADLGLLFDPDRAPERIFCEKWQTLLRHDNPELVVRMNYPYLGSADGFTTYLRTVFSLEAYEGIELEVNQKFFISADKGRQSAVVGALRKTLGRLVLMMRE